MNEHQLEQYLSERVAGGQFTWNQAETIRRDYHAAMNWTKNGFDGELTPARDDRR